MQLQDMHVVSSLPQCMFQQQNTSCFQSKERKVSFVACLWLLHHDILNQCDFQGFFSDFNLAGSDIIVHSIC